MTGLVRVMFPLIGYFCTATVITLAASLSYMRMTGMLDDEKMFKMASVLHDINLEKISEQYELSDDDVPPEETSYKQAIEISQIARLQLQARIDDLDKNIRAFKDLEKSVNFNMSRYNLLKKEVDQYLDQLKDKARDTGLVAVRQQLETLNPKKQAKPLFLEWIEEDRIDDVILLLNGISPRSRRAIILAFDSPDDVQMLKRIYERMLSGHPEKTEIEKRLKQLEQLNQEDR